MECLGSGLSQQEGPKSSSLAWPRGTTERLTWLKRSEHKGDSRTEKGRHRLEMALSAKAEIFNSILKCKGKGRPSEEFKQ